MTRTDITKELLEDLYLSKELNRREIADLLKCNCDTISGYINKYNILHRTTQGLKPKIKISKDELYELYWNREMSLKVVAGVLGCSPRSVARLMEDYNITRRTTSEAAAKIEVSEEELHNLYWNRGMNIDAIADMLGCHWISVYRIMRKYGIKSRTREEYKTKIKISKDELHDLHWNRGMNTDAIADKVGCSSISICRIMKKNGIDRRPGACRSMALEKNPAWKGGVSFEPYCPEFNEAFKESIRDKFNRTCFLCPTTEQGQMNTMRSQGKRPFKLAVHHVDYNKDCLCDDSDCEFVPLCLKCHAKTNNNREYYEAMIIGKLEAV